MNKFERINELDKLLKDGLISQEEYKKEKLLLQNDTESLSPQIHKVESSPTRLKKFRLGSRKDIWYASILAILLLATAYFFTDGFKMLKFEKESKRTLPIVNVYFQKEELFPVYLNYLKNTKKGLMDITITNPDNISKTVEITYGFPDFGELENKSVHIESGSIKKLLLTPFSSKLLNLNSPTFTTLIVKVIDEQNTTLYSDSWNIKINPGDEIPWKIDNKDYTNLIASWITPKDRFVQELVRKARDKNNGKIIPVNKMNEDEFMDLVKDLFNTVKDEGITYTKSNLTFGEGSSQRIRLPKLTLKTKSANSIDGSVLLASLFENVGLRPYIVILSDHAIVGVSRPDQENDKIYIETTLMGRSIIESILSFETTFTAATKSGKEVYNKAYGNSSNQEGGKFIVIDVYKARKEGVLPLN